MKFKRNVKIEQGLPAIVMAPLANVIFLVPVLYILFSSFVSSPTINVQLPKTVTSDAIADDNIVITITGENVIYWNGKIIAVKDLKAQLSQQRNKNIPVLIKTDRRASVGRIVDVWDLCRALGMGKVNIATDQGQ